MYDNYEQATEFIDEMIKEKEDADICEDLTKICESLIKKGYAPANQLVGYLMSRNPSYITSSQNARNLIMQYEVDELLEFFVTYFMKHENVNLKRDSIV